MTSQGPLARAIANAKQEATRTCDSYGRTDGLTETVSTCRDQSSTSVPRGRVQPESDSFEERRRSAPASRPLHDRRDLIDRHRNTAKPWQPPAVERKEKPPLTDAELAAAAELLAKAAAEPEAS